MGGWSGVGVLDWVLLGLKFASLGGRASYWPSFIAWTTMVSPFCVHPPVLWQTPTATQTDAKTRPQLVNAAAAASTILAAAAAAVAVAAVAAVAAAAVTHSRPIEYTSRLVRRWSCFGKPRSRLLFASAGMQIRTIEPHLRFFVKQPSSSPLQKGGQTGVVVPCRALRTSTAVAALGLDSILRACSRSGRACPMRNLGR